MKYVSNMKARVSLQQYRPGQAVQYSVSNSMLPQRHDGATQAALTACAWHDVNQHQQHACDGRLPPRKACPHLGR